MTTEQLYERAHRLSPEQVNRVRLALVRGGSRILAQQFDPARRVEPATMEQLRRTIGGSFQITHRRPESRIGFDSDELRDRARLGMMPRLHRVEPLIVVDEETARNIVTNQGLDYWLDTALSGGTAITAWYVTVSKTNTTPLATHTYASPGYTEIATTDVDETTRQAWTDGGISSQSCSNSASPAVYTAKTTVTAYGSGLVGGGSVPSTLANTGGGGKLYASSLYASSKALADDDTLTVTYTFGGADDGA